MKGNATQDEIDFLNEISKVCFYRYSSVMLIDNYCPHIWPDDGHYKASRNSDSRRMRRMNTP